MDFSSATATQHPGSESLPIPAKTFQTKSQYPNLTMQMLNSHKFHLPKQHSHFACCWNLKSIRYKRPIKYVEYIYSLFSLLKGAPFLTCTDEQLHQVYNPSMRGRFQASKIPTLVYNLPNKLTK
jgi:hypothetical protein